MAPMAPKRSSPVAASPRSGRGGRGAKVAKVADPFQPIYDLLQLLEGCTDSASDMMRVSLPHALGTAKSDRHVFQSRMVDALADLVCKTEAVRNEDVAQSEASISQHRAEQETACTRLEAAREVEMKLEGEKQAACVAQGEAEASLKQAEDKLCQEKTTKHQLEQHSKTLAEARAHFEAEIAEAWVPTRDGTFSPKDWRSRQRAITRVVACLNAAHAPESLGVAAQGVLKEKPEVRGAFGLVALEHCEKAFAHFLHSSQAEIDEQNRTDENQALAVAAASQVVADDRAKSEAQADLQIAAENRWCDAASESGDIAEEINQATVVAEKLALKLQKAQGALSELQGLSATFLAMRDAEPASATPVP